MEKIGKYITKYVKGKTPKELYEVPAEGLLPYLSPDYLRDKAAPEFYALPSTKTVQVDDGEVIVLWDGSNAGEILISKKGILASTMVKLDFDEDEIYKPYYSYSFLFLEYVLKAKTAGSGIPHADKGVIKRLEFFKPEKTEQKAIATILSKVDEAIKATENSIKAADKLKKSLMQNLLTGKLKPDGTWRKEDEFYKDEKFGNVPLGWKVKKVKEISNCLDSNRKPIKAADRKGIAGEYRYYGAAGIIDYINDYIFDGRYILFGEDGENLISRKLPHAFIVEGKFWVNNHAHILEAIEGASDLDYLCYQLEFKNYENIVYGSAQPKINKSDLNKIRVLIPEQICEQIGISNVIKQMDQIIENKKQKERTLQKLKKSLMQNLLTGKVRVDLNKIEKLINEN